VPVETKEVPDPMRAMTGLRLGRIRLDLILAEVLDFKSRQMTDQSETSSLSDVADDPAPRTASGQTPLIRFVVDFRFSWVRAYSL